MVYQNSQAGAVSRTRWSVPAAVPALLVCGIILVAGCQNKKKSPASESPKPASVSPKLGERIQITNDGLPKDGLVADRSRLYFIQRPVQGAPQLQAYPIAGGPGTVIDAAIPEPRILDVSPDSELLVSSGKLGPGDPPLWVVPASGGVPRRLGQIRAAAAAWMPDGKILFSRGRDLYRAEHDGSQPVKVATTPGPISFLRVSPDGIRMRFTMGDPPRSAIWDAQADGTAMKPLVPLPGGPAQACGGRWTPDGKYFVYESAGDLWMIVGTGPISGRVNPPAQLTSGPLAYHDPVPGRDGRKLFAIAGVRPAAEGMKSSSEEIYAFDWQLP